MPAEKMPRFSVVPLQVTGDRVLQKGVGTSFPMRRIIQQFLGRGVEPG